jgi:type IV secretory pathway TrbD component
MEAARRLGLREKSYRNVVADCAAATIIFALLLCLAVLGDVAMWLIAHNLAPWEGNL